MTTYLIIALFAAIFFEIRDEEIVMSFGPKELMEYDEDDSVKVVFGPISLGLAWPLSIPFIIVDRLRKK